MFHDPFVAALALIGVVIIVASLLSGAVERSGAPQVAIFLLLGAMLGPAGLGVIENLRKATRGVHFVAVSPDDDPDTVIRTVRAGAHEHLSLPLSQHDLFKICIKVAEACRGTARDDRGGALWVVYGPKGGGSMSLSRAFW